MKVWENSVYAPNRGKKAAGDKKPSGVRRKRGKSLAKRNAGGAAGPGAKPLRHRAGRTTGRTLGRINRNRRISSPGAIILHNPGESMPVKQMAIAGLGGAGIAGVAIFLGEKYLLPKLPVDMKADTKSGILGAGVTLACGFGAAKVENKDAKVALFGAAIVGLAYTLNELFGKSVKDMVQGTTTPDTTKKDDTLKKDGAVKGMFLPARGLGNVELVPRALGGVNIPARQLQVEPRNAGMSGADLALNNRVW